MIKLTTTGIVVGITVHAALAVYTAFQLQIGCNASDLAVFAAITTGLVIPAGIAAALVSSLSET